MLNYSRRQFGAYFLALLGCRFRLDAQSAAGEPTRSSSTASVNSAGDPQRANPRFRGNFKKPHAWDLGKRFRRVAEAAGIKQLRIHDLRHFTASTLTSAGVADNIISLLTGHKSRELRRYQHLREDLKRGTVDLIAKTIEDAQQQGPERCI